jgi:NADPH:quinone reductase-like Zn-dependent oxidoreductase
MKALQLSKVKELNLIDTPVPANGSGEVLVKIKAAALNHREIWISKGLYPGMTLPCILGADGTGIVEAIGADADPKWINEEVIIYPAFDWGDNNEFPLKRFRVLGMPEAGTLSEYIVIPQSNLHIKPKYLSWEEAAALPVAYLTAWRALKVLGKIKEGDHVLITGAGGGVAQAGLAFATSMGAKVFVTSSCPKKIKDAIEHGAISGINYKDEAWPEKLRKLSCGIDVVLDSSPLPNLDDYLIFLKTGARIVAYGSTGSRKTTLNISKFFLRHISFIGTAMGSPRDFQNMLDYLEMTEIRPRIHHIYPFNEVIKALKDLESGNQIGKLVVKMHD